MLLLRVTGSGPYLTHVHIHTLNIFHLGKMRIHTSSPVVFLWTLYLVPSRSLTTGFVSAPSSDGVRIMRAEPGDYLTCRRLSQLAVEAFYGEHSWTHGPAMYVQRGIIESDVLLDLAARLRYYEEARYRELTHVGAVYVAQVEATGALLGFADVGLSLYDRQKDSFSLPKRPEGDSRVVASNSHELRPYLSNLAVDASQRRSGIGARLVAACEAEAASWTQSSRAWKEQCSCGGDGGDGGSSSSSGRSGCSGERPCMWLEVSLSNTGAFGFYHV